MQTIYVNNIRHRVTKVGKEQNGWVAVYLSKEGEPDNASCHSLPVNWFNDPKNRYSVITSGNKYTK